MRRQNGKTGVALDAKSYPSGHVAVHHRPPAGREASRLPCLLLAQSGGADVHDRMSALGVAAEEIGRARSVKSDVRDRSGHLCENRPKLTYEDLSGN